MDNVIDLQGTIKYQVSFNRNGKWKVFGGEARPIQFWSEERAIETANALQSEISTLETLIVRVEKVYFSDLATRQVCSITTYTGVKR
jgi:hypothetical protein